jgi:hypothetical protein
LVYVKGEFVAQQFDAGDILIFQLESGFGLLKVLGIDEVKGETVWHLQAFEDLFLDTETADLALENPYNLRVSIPHVALTNRAFESTQTAKMTNQPLTGEQQEIVDSWRKNPNRQVSDRSIRLMLGLR